jgi:integrase
MDESNVRKAFNRMLDAAGLHRRGPHQPRHTFASLLLMEGVRQLGHRDASITLRVYAHWVPDTSAAKAVDLLDDANTIRNPEQPTTRSAEWKNALATAPQLPQPTPAAATGVGAGGRD